MNVAVVGSGGREHAISYQISKSEMLDKLFILPGNPGTAKLGRNVNVKIEDHKHVIEFCKKNKIELVVIGPEQPLVDGLADDLRSEGIKVFGPNKDAAEIEAHKSYAKFIMDKYNIPTSAYKEFTAAELDNAREYVMNGTPPLVIKADGLAAGKGVLICNTKEEAIDGLNQMFIDKRFGDAGNKIVIEDYIDGEEASVFAITDGERFYHLPSSQDHKRIGDGDTGLNTGGMGAYSPAPIVDDSIMSDVRNKIIIPVLRGLKEEGRKFNGCLYCGLIITEEGPKVIEFNCRFGDPETQAVLPLLKGDFLKLLYSTATENLDQNAVSYSGGNAVTVVAASEGYPGYYHKGFDITGIEEAEKDEEIIVFHAGTKEKNGELTTNGGRVLAVTSVVKVNDLRLAKQKAYSALEKIDFKGIYYRKDIADKAIRRL